MFAAFDCYRSLPEKFAVWISIGIKSKGILKDYIGRRKKSGFSSEGYEGYSHTLGLVEFDTVNNLYRVIPTVDLDEKDQQLGTSSLLEGKKASLLKGIKGDWSKIESPRTNKAIQLLFNFFYRPASLNT
jgi:hypothetical protein